MRGWNLCNYYDCYYNCHCEYCHLLAMLRTGGDTTGASPPCCALQAITRTRVMALTFFNSILYSIYSILYIIPRQDNVID